MKNTLCFLLAIGIIFSCSSDKEKTSEAVELGQFWKFKTGDDMTWAQPGFDDADWDTIAANRTWESQDYGTYDGFAWYRKSFYLPSGLKDQAYFKDSLQINIGQVDDTEETYLNGQLIGQNGRVISVNGDNAKDTFMYDYEAYKIDRNYILASDDPRIKWNDTNVIAVRVHDHGGGGGLYGTTDKEVSMVDVKDFIHFDKYADYFELLGKDKYSKKITLGNSSATESFEGIISVEVKNAVSNEIVFASSTEMTLEPGTSDFFEFVFDANQDERHVVEYSFEEERSGKMMVTRQEMPYILTPPAPDKPMINGAKVTAARPGRPFLFLIPVSGKKPVTISAENLPEGLVLNQENGILSGAIQQAGEYNVRIKAENEAGTDSSNLLIKVGDEIALTPPMGWNSWNCWGLSVDQEKVRNAAKSMKESGLADYGWTFINIDDGWEAAERTPGGELLANEKFPDMKELADYCHGLGLKLGIYSSPGPLTCGGYLGSYQHEYRDAKTWAGWGIDYLKHDWCSYRQIAPNNSIEELQRPYHIMRDALDKVDRDIVYSLCQYGMGDVWKWGPEVGGNLWRTTGDIVDTWESMKTIGFGQAGLAPYAGPGHWNDPDMLVVGWVGWGPSLHQTRLTASEQYTHISLWCLLSAPLLLGNDLTRLDDFTMNLLTNREVLAVNQDPLGEQAERVFEDDDIQIWSKKMQDGSLAVGLFNLSDEDRDITLDLSQHLGMEGKYKIRDLWRQKDLGAFENIFDTRVPFHGVMLINIAR